MHNAQKIPSSQIISLRTAQKLFCSITAATITIAAKDTSHKLRKNVSTLQTCQCSYLKGLPLFPNICGLQPTTVEKKLERLQPRNIKKKFIQNSHNNNWLSPISPYITHAYICPNPLLLFHSQNPKSSPILQIMDIVSTTAPKLK